MQQGDSSAPISRGHEDHYRLVRFHARNAALVFLVSCGLVLSLLVLLALHNRKIEKRENREQLRHFEVHVLFLDDLLSKVTSHLRTMRLSAEADLLETRLNPDFDMPAAFPALQSGEQGFDLDHPPESFTRESTGNLTGEGAIEGREQSFYREIRMALRLNPLFRSARECVHNRAWVYYLSKNGFINLYPWNPSGEWRFTRQTYGRKLYTLGLPENNPDRSLYWTPLYVDEVGKGLMTTCGVPVYDNETFLGVIAFDLTVDYLNGMMETSFPHQGRMFLVNAEDQLIAHPSLVHSDAPGIKTLEEALPDSFSRMKIDVRLLPENRVCELPGYTVLNASLKNAPWKAYYLEPEPDWWSGFGRRIGWAPLWVVLVFAVIAVGVLLITHLRFIMPAEKFVRYILERSAWKPSDLDREVPRIWKPWFRMMDRTFKDNEELTRRIRRHSRELEQTVRERTLELRSSNEQLRREIGEREEAEKELRKSEANYREIFNSMNDMIFVHDFETGRILDVNRNTVQVLGYSLEELVGNTIERFSEQQPPYSGEDAVRYLEAARRGEPQRFEWRLRRKDGNTFWVEVSLKPSVINGKKVILAVARDVSERIRMEKEKERLESELLQSQKMESIGTLAGGIAHDFNNILGIILGSAELALDDTPEWSPVRKNVEEIRDAALRAQEVIRRLMRFSRKSEYEPRPVRLGALVEDALNLLRATIPVTVRIDVSVPEDLPAILADSTQVHQVILNLCTNAAQAMEKEGGVLTLRVAPYALGEKRPVEFREMQPGEYLALEVGDTGPGIDPGIVNRIFDPYFTTKEVGKGSGMGLSVVHGIMRNHGGGIRVTSEPGKGARFTALFPVSKKDPEDAPTPDYDGEPSSGGEERILVVDDEENVLRVVKHMLVGFGYGVETFTDPQKALEAFRAEPERFDLVLSDLTMPGITGDRLTKEVHSIRPELPVILTSGYSETLDEKAMLETGAADFIEKPVRKADLGRRVRQALDEASRIRREED